jgi:hypothetical protein
MAPRRQKKPIEALNTIQTIDFSSTEDTIQCEVPIDPRLLITESESLLAPESLPESLPELTSPSQPLTEDQDRIEWTPEMIQVLFAELLEQVQDGKRADSGFKKEAWESVLREVQRVYTGPYTIPLPKVKAKEQAFKALYKDWKFLRDQSGFGWDEETRMITASDQAWNDIITVSSYSPLRRGKSNNTNVFIA